MLINLILVLIVILKVVSGQWTIDEATCNGIIVGVSASGLNSFAPASKTDGTLSTIYGKQSEASSPPVWTVSKIGQGLALSAAINSKQESYFSSISLSFSYSNDSTTFTKVEGLVGSSQSLSFINNDDSILAAVGSFKKDRQLLSGVALASGGKLVSIWETPSNASVLRYGSFPSSTTWFLTAGMWPADDTDDTDDKVTKSEFGQVFSKRVALNHDATFSKKENKRNLQSTDDGWVAQILKTQDGGKTFAQVFVPPGEVNYYFNQISCPTESQCVAVGEGNDSNGVPVAVVFTTDDGGATWKETLNAVGTIYSITAVQMIDSKNGWIGATTLQGKRSIGGTFYITADGGMTWQLQQTLADCELILDLEFSSNGAGFASCLASSGSTACIAQYIP